MLFKLTVRVDKRLTKSGDKRFALVWEGERGEKVTWEGIQIHQGSSHSSTEFPY
jgi:hypothetical protein